MAESLFKIGAPGVDTARLVAEIQSAVAEKMKQGVYTDSRVGRAELPNLANFKTQDEFLAFYIECLKDAVFVDINDFDIIERRQRLGGLLVALKRVVWKLLKFYTYRLWSQQNQVNGLLLAAIEGLESRNQERLRALEERVAQMERARPA
jgi:hypothetical protein